MHVGTDFLKLPPVTGQYWSLFQCSMLGTGGTCAALGAQCCFIGRCHVELKDLIILLGLPGFGFRGAGGVDKALRPDPPQKGARLMGPQKYPKKLTPWMSVVPMAVALVFKDTKAPGSCRLHVCSAQPWPPTRTT